MKKSSCILLLTVMAMLSFGQTAADTSRHLVFNGIPIDGTLEQYQSRLQQKGFLLLSTQSDLVTLKVEVEGYKECVVGVSSLEQRDLVYEIGILFPDRTTWATLSSNYFDLKKGFLGKYGKPDVEIEKFDSVLQSENDEIKMQEVGVGRCRYRSIWKTEKGTIYLSIDHSGTKKKFIRLTYVDKINYEAKRKRAG